MALCREAVEEELERTRPAEAAELHPDPDDDIRPGDPPYERQYAAPVAYAPPAPGPTWTPPPALAGPPPAADNGRQYSPPKTGRAPWRVHQAESTIQGTGQADLRGPALPDVLLAAY